MALEGIYEFMCCSLETIVCGTRAISMAAAMRSLSLLLLLVSSTSSSSSSFRTAAVQQLLELSPPKIPNNKSSATTSSCRSSSSNGARGGGGGEDGRADVEAGFMKWVAQVGERYRRRRRAPPSFVSMEQKTVAHALILVDQRLSAASTGASSSGAGAAAGGAAPIFTSIQAAVDWVPENNVVRVKIQIASGTYVEKVLIPRTKPFITLEGSGNTTIQWGDTANMLGADGTPIGTYKTATVGVDASYFIAKNITFKNTAALPPIGSTNQQAVALRISGDAALFIGCQFVGTQDTLYDHKGRHYFQDCYIAGSMDFIFGDGLSMYKNCHLHAIGAPYQEALTAQARDSPEDNTGFSFVNCKVTGTGVVYLGRAWGTFSRVVYSYTYMDSIIIPKGWNDWGDPKRHATVYYGQFKCYGPGANASGRASWSKELTARDALPFIETSFIDGT